METLNCQVCGGVVELGANATLCRLCETPLHPECWEYNGGCATYACKESPAVKNQAASRGAVHVDQPRSPVQDADGRAGGTHNPWRAHALPYGQTRPVRSGGLGDLLSRTLGLAFMLFVGFAFLAGMYEGATKGGGRSSGTGGRGRLGTRADVVRNGDHEAMIRALKSITAERAATRDEVKAAGSAAQYNPDPLVRLAGTEALGAIRNQGTLPQEYLCALIGSRDVAQRKMAREAIARSGRLSLNSARELIHRLGGASENADEAMDLLDALAPPANELLAALKGQNPPPIYSKRLQALATRP